MNAPDNSGDFLEPSSAASLRSRSFLVGGAFLVVLFTTALAAASSSSPVATAMAPSAAASALATRGTV